MPPKPKSPRDLVIQMLSTGEFVRESFVDDLSGQPMQTAEVYGPFRPIESATEHQRRESELRRSVGLSVLARAGLLSVPETQRLKPTKPLKRRF